MSRAEITLDYGYMMADSIGAPHGISGDRIDELAPSIARIHEEIEGDLGKEPEERTFGFTALPYQTDDGIAEIERCAGRIAGLAGDHLVLGIGGSYMGARAACDAVLRPYHNELDAVTRGAPRIYFLGNNMDPERFEETMSLLRNRRSTGGRPCPFTVSMISKSGETLETALAFRLVRAHLGRESSDPKKALKDAVVIITDPVKGVARALANHLGCASFPIPGNVGGRYSVLSPAGLLPMAVAGVKIRDLLAGARAMAERCRNPDVRRNPAYLYAALQYISCENGKRNSVMAVWRDDLESFGLWYDQLCSESLGKNGLGRTPITSVSTRDLHSRGQQHQEGANDRVITNVFVGEAKQDLEVESPKGADPDGLDFLQGKTMGECLRAAMDATNFAYREAGRPTMTLTVPELNEHVLGGLFYLFQLATVVEGRLLGVDPLTQPGVQNYKNYLLGILGKAGYEVHAKRFAGQPPPTGKYAC